MNVIDAKILKNISCPKPKRDKILTEKDGYIGQLPFFLASGVCKDQTNVEISMSNSLQV